MNSSWERGKINSLLMYIKTLTFILLIFSCNDLDSLSPLKNHNLINYNVGLPLAQKAALKYFKIQKEVFEGWRNCKLSLNDPCLCHNHKGITSAYIFNVIEDNLIKGMLAISASKKWRPLLFTKTISLQTCIENLISHHNLRKDVKIQFICINNTNLIFKIIDKRKIDTYYSEGFLYRELNKNQITALQLRADSISNDYIQGSINIWNSIENDQ